MPAFPATPPTLPHSTSSPSLSSPKPPSVPKNYHPYAIQTTASSVLTRSNSSPSQPLSAYRHKPSRSMSSLSHPGSPPIEEPESDSAWRRDKRDRERTKSMDMSTPSRGGLRRSDKMGSFPSLRDEDIKAAEEKVREPTLPLISETNPRVWTPADVAAYLEWHLRTGGIDGQGQTLPPRLVEDIKSWVFRAQVNGRIFLKGSEEEWSTSTRPPPFMPLLLAMSRKLRRTSLQGRMRTSMSDTSALIGTPVEHSAFGTGSVLLEEEEIFDDDLQEMSGVKRMAQSIETRSSASEASGDERDHRTTLQPQWTGGSSSGYSRRPVLKRDYTGGSSASAKAVGPLVGEALRRIESRDSHGGLGDSEASPMVKHGILPADTSDGPGEPEEEEFGGTIKGAPPMLSAGLSSSNTSPPPPYASPYLDSSPQSSPAPAVQPSVTGGTSLTPLARAARSSVTPTPDRPSLQIRESSGLVHESEPRDDATPSSLAAKDDESPEPPHMANMQHHHIRGNDPYAALRRSSSSSSNAGKRLPTLSTIRRAQGSAGPAAGDDDSGVVEMSPTEFVDMLSTARRVTLRPGPARVSDIFLPPAAEGPTEKEQEMERTVQDLLSRIKELESRLETVENKSGHATPANQPSRSVSPTAMTRPSSPILAMLPESVLESFGFSFGQNGDAMPRRVRELPAYLFLMGVGVGAVMVRVLLGRSR